MFRSAVPRQAREGIMNGYGFWADVLVAIHVAYVGFVVFGELAVLVGLALRQRWARNPWFRCSHLAAVLVVAVQFPLGIDCPLTTWESNLRKAAGQEASGETFVGRCLHRMIFHPVDNDTILLINAAVGLL